MFTDSSAEASALGSGPRGRRFKSALSENQTSVIFVELQLVIKMLQLSLKINVSSRFSTPVFRGVFFGNYNSD